MKQFFRICVFLLIISAAASAENVKKNDIFSTMRKASAFFTDKLAVNGGYVYHWTLDLSTRWGEGKASPTQIWVQPPGTPAVGMAFLKAYEATGDTQFLNAAGKAAEALCYGQLKSGGWQNMIDFDQKGKVYQYRNGKGGGKNYSTFDDGQTQSALKFLILTDKAYEFRNKIIHEAVIYSLDGVLGAQFENGGFPQVWTGPVQKERVVKAQYPDYDWRTEGRIKNYWDMYTLNDNVCGYLTETLISAYEVYKDEKYKKAVEKLGDFLILAQMPAPQQGWAQQYNYDMIPVWARKFEPPGIAGDETQEAISTLLDIYRFTGKEKYLKPIPPALDYLEKSLLPDGQLARFYELKTNKPLYMFRKGKVYSLTYDDSNLPGHYAFKITSRINKLKARLDETERVSFKDIPAFRTVKEQEVKDIIKALDDQGRWVSTYKGERLVGQPKFQMDEQYISSEVFCRNMELLSYYLIQNKGY